MNSHCQLSQLRKEVFREPDKYKSLDSVIHLGNPKSPLETLLYIFRNTSVSINIIGQVTYAKIGLPEVKRDRGQQLLPHGEGNLLKTLGTLKLHLETTASHSSLWKETMDRLMDFRPRTRPSNKQTHSKSTY